MSYKENPKTQGSGIKCVIAQSSKCPLGCPDCFFQNGRSYLEPLAENLPNVPKAEPGIVYRINDGNDSSVNIQEVIEVAQQFPMRFYNTSLTIGLDNFDAPVVLTLNPRQMLNEDFYRCAHEKLMFVRILTNTWNFRGVVKDAIMWYADREIPIVLTFMAYHQESSIPEHHRQHYEQRSRTKNDYWCIRNTSYRYIMEQCKLTNYAKWISSCSEEGIETHCSFCGNCLRLYFRKIEEMKVANNNKLGRGE